MSKTINTDGICVCRLRIQQKERKEGFMRTRTFARNSKRYIFAVKLNDETFQDVISHKKYKMWDRRNSGLKNGNGKEFVTRTYLYRFEEPTTTVEDLQEKLADPNFEGQIRLISRSIEDNYELDMN